MTEAGAENNGGTESAPDQYRGEQSKPRSGYARLRNRHHHLVEMHERLQVDHEGLIAVHAELERAFTELLDIHNTLLADLKRARPQPQPVRFGQHLMGSPYGR